MDYYVVKTPCLITNLTEIKQAFDENTASMTHSNGVLRA